MYEHEQVIIHQYYQDKLSQLYNLKIMLLILLFKQAIL